MLTYRKNTKNLKCLFHDARGFNLIEIMLALVLFAIAVPAVGHLFAVAYQQEAENTNQTQAIFLANALLDEISERRFSESGASPGNCSDAGELSAYSRAAFDDIDDYAIYEKSCLTVPNWGPLSPPRDESGNALADYSKFSQSVSVNNITGPTSGPTARTDFTASPEGTTDYKLVTVTISWNSGRDSVQLHKVFAKY